MNPAIKKLVEEEAPFLALSDDKRKIVCCMNGHELPADRLDVLEAFVNGKKYKKLKTRKTTEDWADRYKPFLVPSVNFPNMMFCALTNHVIQKKQAVVEEHLKGRKFKTAQERFQADKTELYEEPTIAEMEAAIAKEQNELRETGEEPSEDGSFDFEPMDDADLALALENKPTTTTGKNKGAEKKKKKGDRPRAKRKPADSKPAAARKNRRGNP